MKWAKSAKLLSLSATILAGLLAVMVACGGGDSEQEASSATTTQPAKQAAASTTTTSAAAKTTTTTATAPTTAKASPAATANVVINVSGTPTYGGMIRRFGFKDVPADAPISELLYLQLKGGSEPVIEAPRNPKETPLEDLVEDADNWFLCAIIWSIYLNDYSSAN